MTQSHAAAADHVYCRATNLNHEALASILANTDGWPNSEDLSVGSAADGELALHNRTVLVCEDEPFIAYDIASSIEEAGGIVIGPFATVKEALAFIDQTTPDYATLDVNLLDGEVTPVIQKLIKARVPVVVNTGTELPDEVADLGITVFLKPTEPDELISALVGG